MPFLCPRLIPTPEPQATPPPHAVGTLSHDSSLHLGASISSIGSSSSVTNTSRHPHLRKPPWMDLWFEIPSSEHHRHCSHLSGSSSVSFTAPSKWMLPRVSTSYLLPSTGFLHHTYADDSQSYMACCSLSQNAGKPTPSQTLCQALGIQGWTRQTWFLDLVQVIV